MTTALKNPFRYRGYYYDNETGFYYLQSRYYDPVVGRFINADDTMFLGLSGTTTSYNLYAYCDNNPVNYKDPLGTWIQFAVGAVLGGLLNIFLYWLDCKIAKVKVVWWKALGSFALGAASGALAATGVKLIGQIVGNVIISLASLIFSATPISEEDLLVEIFAAVIIGIVSGIAGGAGLGHMQHLNTQTKQFLKRIARETAKAIAYFVKSNKTLYKKLVSSIIKAVIAGSTAKYGKALLIGGK